MNFAAIPVSEKSWYMIGGFDRNVTFQYTR